jgi:hypothetical protein
MLLEKRVSEISGASKPLEVDQAVLAPPVDVIPACETLWDRVLSICDQHLPHAPERYATSRA